MKYLLLCLLSLIIVEKSGAQTLYGELGAVGSFFKEDSFGKTAFGGQITANYELRNGFVFGAGFQALRFEKSYQYGIDDRKGYCPLYGRIGYAVSASRLAILIHADEGFGFYKNIGLGPADGPVPIRGGFYFSPGISVRAMKKLSPYIDLRYTHYQFRTDYGSSKYTNNINAFTASIGICISNKKGK